MKYFLWIAITAAALFWSWQAWNHDILGDEVGYAFRSVGYLDYLGTSFQTTPVEWYNNLSLPWWTNLSFHDHPPFFFVIQNIFFTLFGDSVFVARLPAIFAGIISAIFFYLLLLRFAPVKFAIVATSLFVFNAGIVSLFRSSLIEPVLLSLILTSIYSFFLFLDRPGRFWLLGIVLGFLALTKYIGVFLVPVFLIYIGIYRRELFRDWRLWSVFAIALLIFSPVLIYNGYLYKEKGHFDLQLSYLLGQATPEWMAQLGKSQNPFSVLLLNLMVFYGIPAIGSLILSGALMIFYGRKSRLEAHIKSGLVFLALYIVFVTLLLVFIGSAHRFLGLYAPAFFAVSAILVYYLWFIFKPAWIFRILAVLLILADIGYAVRTNFINAHDYGLVKLDKYFEREFRGRVSGVIPQTDNTHLNETIKIFADRKKDNQPHFSVIVYNDNVDISTILWIFTRKFFYDGVPTMYVENFKKTLAASGGRAFDSFMIYYVQSTPHTLLNPFKADNEAGDLFEQEILAKGLRLDERVLSRNGLEMFRVYKFLMAD